MPYKIHGYYRTYKTGFNLISFFLIFAAILFIFFIISTYYENYWGRILFSITGCSIVGVKLITDLTWISSPEYLGIGFYFAYFSWCCFCIISLLTIRTRIKLPLSDIYKTLNEYEMEKLLKLKGFYLFSLIVFYILASFPFLLYSYGPFISATGFSLYIFGGGWVGYVTLVISYIYLHIYQIHKSVIMGFIGNFMIGLNLILLLFPLSEEIPATAYLISILVWLFITYINIAQLLFLYHKYGSPRKSLIKLKRNKLKVNLLNWVNGFYLICVINFIISNLFPYSPYSPAYDLSEIGLYYLIPFGLQGLFLIILSIVFLYFLQIRTTYILGIFGSILIGINYIIVLNFVFVEDQQVFYINFYISLSLLATLFLTNILLLLFHLKYKRFFRIRTDYQIINTN
ncbi:MAG: hypothetical protein ACFFDH_13395 [Promethearchaeota archaeon]